MIGVKILVAATKDGRIARMSKSTFEKVFGSWIIIAIVVMLLAVVVYMKANDESFPDSDGLENQTTSQQE